MLLLCHLQHFAHVARPEDSVDTGELEGLIGREMGRENAILDTSPPQKLAGSTW